MKISLRGDLGGYASSLPSIRYIDGVEITKPFVLLAGANGAGKSSLLNMIRASLGLSGDRIGRLPEMRQAIDLEEAGDDLGKLAGFSRHYRQEPKLPDGHPGIVDVRDIAWQGQRSFYFDSRAAGALLGASGFDDHDFPHHLRMITGSRQSSHGQAIGQGWDEAIRWSVGAIDIADIYDDPNLTGGRRALFEELCPGERPQERWLFLDEPEAAIDVGRLFTGLATFLEHAEEGRLRVFCASHSPLFVAGLADHRNVQVVDLGGPQPWLAMQQRVLGLARDEDIITRTAAGIVKQIHKSDQDARRQEERARKKKIAQAISRITSAQLEALVRLHEAIDHTVELERMVGAEAVALEDLRQRGLAAQKSRKVYVLTDLGLQAIDVLQASDLPHPEVHQTSSPDPIAP